MISFDVGDKRFNFKASGVAIYNGRILLTSDENVDFWYLPGGRVEVLETTADTLRREMREELGVAVEVDSLLWVVENFFDLQGTPYHELALFYLMSFPDSMDILQKEDIFEGCEPTNRLLFKWFEINELERFKLYPSFLKSALKNIPKVTEHVVIRQ